MPIMNLYSIYDTVAQEYGPIFMAKNDEVAKRNFVNLQKDISPELRGEFELKHVGNFNTETGFLVPYLNNENIAEYTHAITEE